MNLYLAFLHGEHMLMALLLAAIIAFVGFPVLLYLWLWRTEISELKLAFGYFMSSAVLCGVSALSPNDPASILPLTASALGFILTLPWNVLVGWALGEARNAELSDREFAVVMLFSAGFNAVLLYFVAAKMRRLIQ